ncbi:unnamed protein product [Prunus armeniaca]
MGWPKVNIDDVWHPQSSIGGIGAMVCDSGGDFVAGCALSIPNIFFATLGEALAARMGVSLAVDMGFMNVSFESDALQIVSALRSQSMDQFFLGSIVKDTKTLLTQITREDFTYIHRKGNSVAYHVVKFATDIGNFVSWFEKPLNFIVDLLFEDCNL